MTPEEQISTTERFLGLVNKADFDAAAEFIHPEFRLVEQPGLPYAGAWQGREGFLELMNAASGTWSRWRDDPWPYELAADGNRVYKEVHFTATARVTGAVVEMDFIEVFEFEDDLIAEVRAYYWDPERVRAATSTSTARANVPQSEGIATP